MDIFLAIALPMVSAITFVAYKHSSAYPPIAAVLIGILTAAFIGIMAWNSGVGFASREMSDFVPVDGYQATNATIDKLSVFNSPVWFFVGNVVIWYFILLMYLPNILGQEKNKDQDKTEK